MQLYLYYVYYWLLILILKQYLQYIIMILNNRILLNEEKGVIEIIIEPKQHCEWNVALLFYSITIRELILVHDHEDMTL